MNARDQLDQAFPGTHEAAMSFAGQHLEAVQSRTYSALIESEGDGAKYADLYNDLHAAMLNNQTALVWTPGCSKRYQPAIDVVQDCLSGYGEGETLTKLMWFIVSKAARGHDVEKLAGELINRVCAIHAKAHEGDA